MTEQENNAPEGVAGSTAAVTEVDPSDSPATKTDDAAGEKSAGNDNDKSSTDGSESDSAAGSDTDGSHTDAQTQE